MGLPSSGQISISAINTELGRASNTINTFLAGGTTPAVGSLFWLGAQSGTINQTAPHAMSEWYGYATTTTSTTTTTTTSGCPPFGTYLGQFCDVGDPLCPVYDEFANGNCGSYLVNTGLSCC